MRLCSKFIVCLKACCHGFGLNMFVLWLRAPVLPVDFLSGLKTTTMFANLDCILFGSKFLYCKYNVNQSSHYTETALSIPKYTMFHRYCIFLGCWIHLILTLHCWQLHYENNQFIACNHCHLLSLVERSFIISYCNPDYFIILCSNFERNFSAC